MSKWYVGRKHGHIGKVVFKSATTPTKETHGAQYAQVTGPFRTKLSAQVVAVCGMPKAKPLART